MTLLTSRCINQRGAGHVFYIALQRCIRNVDSDHLGELIDTTTTAFKCLFENYSLSHDHTLYTPYPTKATPHAASTTGAAATVAAESPVKPTIVLAPPEKAAVVNPAPLATDDIPVNAEVPDVIAPDAIARVAT